MRPVFLHFSFMHKVFVKFSMIFQVNDKTGELPNSSAWMGGWGKRTRQAHLTVSKSNQIKTRSISNKPN